MDPSSPIPTDTRRFEALPGWELVRVGLEDLAAGRSTVEAALVGLVATPSSPERLHELIVAEVGEERAHSRYNALRRRLASFVRSAGVARTD